MLLLCGVPNVEVAWAVLVDSTGLQNTMICQPQQRNTSGRIFGGFLMRRACAWTVLVATLAHTDEEKRPLVVSLRPLFAPSPP